MKRVDFLFIAAKNRMHQMWQAFWEDETGETNIIAIVIVIGIVVALAITFGDQLQKLFQSLWGKITAQTTDYTPPGG
jgi:Flp pilus assembly pilin Flp